MLACAALSAAALLAGGARSVAAPAPAPAPAETPPAVSSEEFHYHWQLRNLVGVILGLVLPRQGDGDLSFKIDRDGHMKSELVITSPESHGGEFFRYGSEIDVRTMQPIRAWSAFLWRGRSKSESDEIDQKGVLDIVSGIYALRHDPPLKARPLEIWSDGKIYPVVIVPLGQESRFIDHHQVYTLHFSIRPVEIANARRWKGRVEVWLARDAVATPVEIEIIRSLADVRLELRSAPATPG